MGSRWAASAAGDQPDRERLPVAAFKNLLDAIEVQATYVQEIGDWGQLFVPAPAEYWRLLPAAEPYKPGANGWRLPAILSGVECALVRA